MMKKNFGLKEKISNLIQLSENQIIFKNFFALNISFVLLLSCMNRIDMIADTLIPVNLKFKNNITDINVQIELLKNSSQAILYTTQFLGSFILPQFFIETIGFKFTILIAECFYMSYFLANTFPRWSTLIPASYMAGFANSLFTITMGIYFTKLAKNYSSLRCISFNRSQAIFFGLFGFIYFLNYILDSFWFGYIFQLKEKPFNLTLTSFKINEVCASNYCPDVKMKLPNYSLKSSKSLAYLLCASSISSCSLAIIITLSAVDDLNYDRILCPLKTKFKKEIHNLYKLFKILDVWLLAPITIFMGFEITLIMDEFNKMENILVKILFSTNIFNGKTNILFIIKNKIDFWIKIGFGIFGAITSLLSTYTIKYINIQTKLIIMLMTAIANSNLISSWTPNLDESLMMLILVTISFSFTNSISTAHIRSLFGIYYPDNKSSYSAAMVFETFGIVLGSALSTYYCVKIKFYIYSLLALLSLLCFILLDVKTNIRLSFLASLSNNTNNLDLINKTNNNLISNGCSICNLNGIHDINYDTYKTNNYNLRNAFKTDLKRMEFVTF